MYTFPDGTLRPCAARHGRVHGPFTASSRQYTRPRTRTVCRNGPHTAVACRLGTCTRTGRPTCRIHGPDGPCTRPSTRAVTWLCTRYVDGRKRQCTRPVYTAENGRAYGPYTAVYTRRYGPYTAVYTTRYTAVYGRVDGRFRPCRWPVHGRVHGPCTHRHIDTCTRPYTCRVHGPVHGPCMVVYTSRVRGRVRAMYTSEDVRTDGPYTDIYMGGIDGPCARPIHGRVRAVYTARPLYGRVRAVFAGEDVFMGRVHGSRVTGTRHVTRPCTRMRPHNGRLDGRGRPVHGRVTAV